MNRIYVFLLISALGHQVLFAQKNENLSKAEFAVYNQKRLKETAEQHRMVKAYFSPEANATIISSAVKLANVSENDKKAFTDMLKEKYLYSDRNEILSKINRNELNDANVNAYIKGKINEYASYYQGTYLQGKTTLLGENAPKVKRVGNHEIENYLSSKLGTPVVMSIACGNSDFELNNFSGWAGANYNTSSAFNCGAGTPNPMPTAGFGYTAMNTTTDEHGLCNGGNDPTVVTAALPTVSPFGGTTSCRLGDISNGCGAAEMTFDFVVTSQNTNFTYYYAAILYDGHVAADAPKISIAMTDITTGQPIGCAAYYIDATQASGAGSGYLSADPLAPGIYYKPWSAVFVPLTAFIGKTVQIHLITSDCDGTAHKGYAYFDVSCAPFELTIAPFGTCAGGGFTITAPTGAASYTWTSIGPGTFQGATNAQTATVTASGNYQVTMTAFGSACPYTLDTVITISPTTLPIALFSSTPVCTNTPMQFTDQSNPNGGAPLTGWTWNFGNGNTSTQQNPTNIYTSSGTFTVSLTVTNGCVATYTNTVIVLPTPTVIVANMGPYCPGDVVPSPTFTNNPNDPATTYVWTNNNGSIGLNNGGSGIPPSFTVSANNSLANMQGVVTVIPTLNGCVGPPANYTITIRPTPFVNYIPDVEYCPSVNTTAINFTSIPAGPTTYTWVNTNTAIGVGLVSTGTSGNIASFLTINTSTTTVSGTIHVIPNLNGCYGPDSTFNITINPLPTPSFYVNTVCIGSPTKFTDQSYVANGTIVGWAWDFNNDGIFLDASSPNPQTILIPAGPHTIGLNVTSNKGCRNQVYEPVYVNFPPNPNFVGDDLMGCPIHPVNFTESSTAPPPAQLISWSWDFGNGQTSVNQNPTVVLYNNSSPTQVIKYNVSLTVTTDSGCSASITKPNYITVYPQPIAGFYWNPYDVDLFNPTVYFTNTSVGGSGANPINYYFGDVFIGYQDTANWSNLTNPTHIYNDQIAYTYYVTQWVRNLWGCKDSITLPVTINPIFTFYIPNAFSPNGDNKNEGFKGTGIGIDLETYNLWVFDRWGNQCFHSNDLEETWDGRVRHQGEIVQEDVYVWKVKFKDIQGLKHEYHGIVSIVK